MTSPFEHILFVGPHHKNHRGGIGAVLEIYSKHIRPFQFIPTMSYRNKLYELFFFSWSLLRIAGYLLIHRKIRVVHIHGAKDGSIFRKYFVSVIARLFGKKVIVHIHAGAFDECYLRGGRFYRYQCRYLVNHAAALVVLSNRWDDFFRTNFRVNRIVVINNPVEQRIEELLPRAEEGKTNFLFLGRIADHKGIFDLVKIFGDEQTALRGKCRLFAGGNHEVERLQQEITASGIGDIVEYIGWTQGKDKDDYFRKCDYFILPTYEEAMPMTILEAFSYGKPVISTPVGSIPEILTDHYNGLLCGPGDIPALKKLIQEGIDNPQLASQLGKNALQSAHAFYPATIKQELEKLYTTIG